MKRINGFSLIEISIVVLIVSVVASSSLNLIGRKNDAENIANTEKRMRFIANALQVYFNSNAKLPCPANYEVGSYVSGEGIDCNDTGTLVDSNLSEYEGSSSKANILGGFIPYIDIGIPPEFTIDEWGRRITYIVDKDATGPDVATETAHIEIQAPDGDGATDDHAVFRSPTTAEIATSVVDCRDETGATTITIESPYTEIPECAAFLLVSHGKNGYLGFTQKDAIITNTIYSSSLEAGNGLAVEVSGTINTFDDKFNQLPENTEDESNYFDDILVYVTQSKLGIDYNEANQ